MGAKILNRRHIKKAVIQQMKSDYDLARLDYAKLVRPGKGKSKLIGILVALVIYMIGFGGGYYGWLAGVVPEEVLAKIVWIAMVPSSVIGSLTWVIMDARLEYPVRRQMAEYVAQLESTDAKGGRLWRYAPLLESFKIKGVDITKAIFLSREGRGGEIDPQDYAALVNKLHLELVGNESLQITGECSKDLEENLLNA